MTGFLQYRESKGQGFGGQLDASSAGVKVAPLNELLSKWERYGPTSGGRGIRQESKGARCSGLPKD